MRLKLMIIALLFSLLAWVLAVRTGVYVYNKIGPVDEASPWPSGDRENYSFPWP